VESFCKLALSELMELLQRNELLQFGIIPGFNLDLVILTKS
jgi:hypothetical protein